MPDFEEILDQLPAYAIGALDEDEARQVDEYLANCRLCLAEVDAFQRVQEDLALAVPDAVPSGALRRRLMSRVRLTTGEPEYILEASPPQMHPAPKKSLLDIRHFWMWGSLILIVILLITNYWSWSQLQSASVSRESELIETVNLWGTDSAPNANGVVVRGQDGYNGTIMVDSLPPLDESQQYQLWLINDDQRTSGAVFSVGKNGSGSACISAPKSLADYSDFGISIEPAGGSLAPTGNRVLGTHSY